MTKKSLVRNIILPAAFTVLTGLNAYGQNNKESPDFVKNKEISFWTQETDGKLDSLGILRIHGVNYFAAKDSGEGKLGFELYPVKYCGFSKMVGQDKKVKVTPEMKIKFKKEKANAALLADTGKFASHGKSLGEIAKGLNFDNDVGSKNSINGETLLDFYSVRIRDKEYLIPFDRDSLTKKGATNFVAIPSKDGFRRTDYNGSTYIGNNKYGIWRGFPESGDSSILKHLSELYSANYPANSVISPANNTGQVKKLVSVNQTDAETKEEKERKHLNLEGRIVLGVVGAVRTFNEENFNANQADAYVALQLKTGEIWIGPYAEGAFAGSKIITNQLDTVGLQRKLLAYNVYKNDDSLVNTNTKISYPYEAGIAIQGNITEGLGYTVSAGIAKENTIENKYGEKNIWYERNGSILDRAKITNNTNDKHSSWVPTVGVGLQKHLFNNKVDLEISGKYLKKPMLNAAVKFNLSNSKRR